MDTIRLFEKDIEYKNYDCSFNKCCFKGRKPIFNMYLEISDICNAHCGFCAKADCIPKDKKFDYEKFKYILKSLFEKNILAIISITGGEPLLDYKKLDEVLKSIYTINPEAYVSINTNGFNLNNFYNLKFFKKIKEVHISRHFHDDDINKTAFNTPVASLEEIKTFVNDNTFLKVKFNCVLQNGLIDNSKKIYDYLECVSGVVDEVRFINLLQLTDECNNLKVNISNIITDLKKNVNAGLLYDKDICECFSFIYVSDKGIPITSMIRNTKKEKSPYLRQFVYNSQNELLTGFGGDIIL